MTYEKIIDERERPLLGANKDHLSLGRIMENGAQNSNKKSWKRKAREGSIVSGTTSNGLGKMKLKVGEEVESSCSTFDATGREK